MDIQGKQSWLLVSSVSLLLSACGGNVVPATTPKATDDTVKTVANPVSVIELDAALVAAQAKGWQLVWNDEFDQDDVDTNKWSWEKRLM